MVRGISYVIPILCFSIIAGCSGDEKNGQTEEMNQTIRTENEQSINDQEGKENIPSDENTATSVSINDEDHLKNDSETTDNVLQQMTSEILFEQKDNTAYFTFVVKNNSDYPFTFHFATSQQFEYEIRDKEGQVIRKYSEGKSFAAFQTEYPVKPGGSVIFEETVEELPAGSYTINFYLVAKEMQPKASLKFDVK